MHAKALGNCYAVKSGESFCGIFPFFLFTRRRAVNRLNQVFAVRGDRRRKAERLFAGGRKRGGGGKL